MISVNQITTRMGKQNKIKQTEDTMYLNKSGPSRTTSGSVIWWNILESCLVLYIKSEDTHA